MTEGKRCILWIAVSSAPQADESKESLPEQERLLRTIAERNGWRIVDVIIVPGHSRDYYTYAEFCEGVRQDKKINTDAPNRMWDHWARRDFDVFACLDGSRFGRKASIVNEFVGRTYDANAQIWSNRDGWIDPNNKRWYAAMIGMQSEGEIAELVRRRKMGMKRRAKEGLPTGGRTIFSHKVIDIDKEHQKLIVDSTKRRLLDDLGTLILEGVSWRQMEQVMFERFGHADANGKPYREGKFLRIAQSPTFWGHSAQYYLERHRQAATWMFDPSVPPPDGVVIHYYTHEPAFTGERGERIITELKRRATTYGRHKTKEYATRYSGLLICAVCGYYMNYGEVPDRKDKRYGRFYLCASRFRLKSGCQATKRIHLQTLDAFFGRLLEALLELGDVNQALTTLNLQSPQKGGAEDEIGRVAAEIEQEQEAIRRLITKQANAPDEISYMYEDEIRNRAAHLAALKSREATLKAQTGRQQDSGEVVKDLQSLTLARFWQLSEYDQNRYFHRIMGNKRLALLNGEIIGVVNAPPKRPVRKRF